jgi:abortive infection bacteriophage resistance protein
MVAEMMQFAQLSRRYSSLADRSLRNRIVVPLGLTETVLVPFVRHLVDVRNICAHHGRLWNRGFLFCPRLPSKPRDLQLSLDHSAGERPLAKLFNTISMINQVMRNVAPDSRWAWETKAHILSHPTGDLAAMGFPECWQPKPVWR